MYLSLKIPKIGALGKPFLNIIKTAYDVVKVVKPTVSIISNILEDDLESIESFLEKLEGGAAIILKTMKVITEAIDSVTRSLFFAHRSDNNIFFNAVKGVVDVMDISMDIIVPLVEGLSEPLNVLDGVFDQIMNFIKAPFDIFKPAIEYAEDELKILQWLEDIVDHKVSIDLPSGFSWNWFSVSISWSTHSISMKDIANKIQDIKNWIMSLPGIGFIFVSAMFVIL